MYGTGASLGIGPTGLFVVVITAKLSACKLASSIISSQTAFWSAVGFI